MRRPVMTLTALGLLVVFLSGQIMDGGAGYNRPTGGLTISNTFSASNLFLFNTTDSTTPNTAANEFGICLSSYGDPSPNGFQDRLLSVWTPNNGSFPQTEISTYGGIETGSWLTISANTSGSLAGGDLKRNGPFENSAGSGVLAGSITWMAAVRSDIVGAAVQIGVTAADAKNVPLLIGTSAGSAADGGSAYLAFDRIGGLWWDFGGAASSGVLSDGSGHTTAPSTWADYKLSPASASNLQIALGIAPGYVTLANANGGYSGIGEVEVTQLATPTVPTVAKVGTHTAGATTNTYAIVARTNSGSTIASNTASATNCLATLDADNSVRITWAFVNGAKNYDVYRTAGHSTTGIISTVDASSSGQVDSGTGTSTVYFASDTGLAGGSETLPTAAAGYRNSAASIKLGTVSLNGYGTNGNNAAMAFANGAAVPISGTMNVQTTVVGNVDTGTDDLMTYTVPANTIGTNGRGLRITAWGSTANNANAKTLAHSFGASATLSQSLTASIAGRWKATILIFRVSSGNQDWTYELTEGTATLAAGKAAVAHGTTAITDSAAIISKFTATATTTNDVIQEGMTVEVVN